MLLEEMVIEFEEFTPGALVILSIVLAGLVVLSTVGGLLLVFWWRRHERRPPRSTQS
jgi:hypothetical protein